MPKKGKSGCTLSTSTASSSSSGSGKRSLAILPPVESGCKTKSWAKSPSAEMEVTHYEGKSLLLAVTSFLFPHECRAFIRWGESCGFEECDFPSTRETAHRKQGRFSFEDTDSFISGAIFSRVLPFLPPVIDGAQPFSCSRNIRMYKYQTGDSFGRHIDESNQDIETGAVSKLTLLLYLNGGFEEEAAAEEEEGGVALVGGETKFYKTLITSEPLVTIAPVRGTLLLHGHGHRCLIHEAATVIRGCKYVLRTDVMYR